MSAANTQSTVGKPGSFIDLIRQSTADLHFQLEQTELTKKLMSETVTVENYTQYLSFMLAVVDFTEKNIFPIIGSVISDADERRKADLIRNDLQQLPAAAAEIPAFDLSNQNLSLPFALGVMYVVEGSSLGGRFILKHISSKLDIGPANGGSYMNGYAESTGVKWKLFLQQLERWLAEHEQDAQQVIEAARHAFSAIYDHFKKAGE
jgi:heme oxygenase (biliverdin-IX-beta and delta-forming)